MLKLAQTDQQTNRQTNRQTGQKQYVPHYYNQQTNRQINRQTNRQGKNNMSPTTIGLDCMFNFFHEDWTINGNAPPPGGHVFKPTRTIFILFQDIIGKNLLTKFHEDLTINVASIVLTKINSLTPGSRVFQATRTIFPLFQDTIGTNLLTKFHEDLTMNVASRGLERFHYTVLLHPDEGSEGSFYGFSNEETFNEKLNAKEKTTPKEKAQNNSKDKTSENQISDTDDVTKQRKRTNIDMSSALFDDNVGECENLRSHHIIQEMSTRKIPSTASILITSSWSKGTRQQYKYAWQNWVLWNGISHVFQSTGIIFKLVQDINGSSTSLRTIPVSYRSPVRALSEHMPCKPWIPHLSPYLSNCQVSGWVQGSNHATDSGFESRLIAPFLNDESLGFSDSLRTFPVSDWDPSLSISTLGTGPGLEALPEHSPCARARTPIACEASSHSGTLNQEMLLT
ncbi:hypothetical protein DPMN_117745 [Dreissena polymorpha]|uniref:Uncharacterized protein n=1 Tax=Dreissena polymorpha TaxID=45954 RepID=A0A9D4JQI0_DREPO|nr:hypothetical protein DPMN_117745 [Dreissena polymorpha]